MDGEPAKKKQKGKGKKLNGNTLVYCVVFATQILYIIKTIVLYSFIPSS